MHNTQQDFWRFSFGEYDGGHLVPYGLGKQIGQPMGAATLNIFNAGPQLKEDDKAPGTSEVNLIDYATGTCLKTDVITGNVFRDFYFISSSVPADIHLSHDLWQALCTQRADEDQNVPAQVGTLAQVVTSSYLGWPM